MSNPQPLKIVHTDDPDIDEYGFEVRAFGPFPEPGSYRISLTVTYREEDWEESGEQTVYLDATDALALRDFINALNIPEPDPSVELFPGTVDALESLSIRGDAS